MRVHTKILYLIAFLAVATSCSQEKNTIVNRSYHNVTARYNGFFNGRLALQDAYRSMKENHQEDYTSLLPIFISSKDEVVQRGMPGEMYRLYHEYKYDEWARFMSTVTDWDNETYMECLP